MSTDAQVFGELITVFLDHVTKLILIAESLLVQLDMLESQLELIHELVYEENLIASASRKQLLSRLWTKLGGNQQIVQSYDEQLQLLSGLGEYRRMAKAHVASALQTLRASHVDLGDLCEDASNLDLHGSRVSIEIKARSIGSEIQKIGNMIQAKEQSAPELVVSLEG